MVEGEVGRDTRDPGPERPPPLEAIEGLVGAQESILRHVLRHVRAPYDAYCHRIDTPLVPANYPGVVPTTGIVSGLWTQYYPGPSDFAGHVGQLNPVTIDARTLSTNYNVLNNNNGAHELWLRSGVQWDITNNVQFRSQVYSYAAQRHWFNSEVN